LANEVATTFIKQELPIEVIGSDLYGRQFIERVHTLTIQREGGTFLLANKLGPDVEVVIHNLKTREEALARVVGQIRQEGESHVYAVAFVDSHMDLWRMALPDSAPPTSVVLECTRCRTVLKHSLSDIEMQVFSARHDLTRVCNVCKTTTIWKETTRQPTEETQPTAPQQKPLPAKGASRWEEKRKNRRTTLRTPACIRFSMQEEVVLCEDISRGGFRFVGVKQYPKGTRIQAAVPYTDSGNNIFSWGSVVYCSKIPDGRYRHGVSYITVGPGTR